MDKVIKDTYIKFSIIIPLYNKEKYIEDCILSIKKQSYKSYEIIVVDDSSTDESVSIVKSLALNDKSIRLISKDNEGPGCARNDGLKYAKGEYVFFLDADDFWINDKILEKVSNTIKKLDLKPNVIGTNICKLKNGQIVNTKLIKYVVEGWVNFEEIGDEIYFFTSYIYKRDFLENKNIKFPKTRLFEDPVFMSQVIVYAQRFYFIEDRFYVYRLDNNPNDVSRVYKLPDKKQMDDYIESLFEVAKLAKKHKRPLMLDKLKKSIKQTEGINLLRQFVMGNYSLLTKIFINIDELEIDIKELPQLKYLRKALIQKANCDIARLNKYLDAYEQIVLYGAGLYGQMLATVLIKSGIKPEKIAFCQTYCEQNMEICGIKCKDIGFYCRNKKNTIVVVSVNNSLQSEIVDKLVELQFDNVILLTDELLYSVVMKL